MGTKPKNENMERDTDLALLIVRITNNLRLNADVTEDFFLVNCNDYLNASDILNGLGNLYHLTDITDALNAAGIPYQHVVNGQRFMFGDGMDDSCDCEDDL